MAQRPSATKSDDSRSTRSMTRKGEGPGSKTVGFTVRGEASFICGVRVRRNFESAELFSTHHDELEWDVRHEIIIVKEENGS